MKLAGALSWADGITGTGEGIKANPGKTNDLFLQLQLICTSQVSGQNGGYSRNVCSSAVP